MARATTKKRAKRRNPAAGVQAGDVAVLVGNLFGIFSDEVLRQSGSAQRIVDGILGRAHNPDSGDSGNRQNKRKEYEAKPSSTWRKTLGITSIHPTVEEVKSRFRVLAAKHHPDHGGDAKTLLRIISARDQALLELQTIGHHR
jgi:hypothetical protein